MTAGKPKQTFVGTSGDAQPTSVRMASLLELQQAVNRGAFDFAGDGCNSVVQAHRLMSMAIERNPKAVVFYRPGTATLKEALHMYSKFKQAHPTMTAVIAVPQWLTPDWRKQLQGMTLLRTYPRGLSVLTDSQGRVASQPYDIDVYCDPPTPPRQLCSTVAQVQSGLVMQFKGDANNVPMRAFIDTGATDVFVSSALCERAGVQWDPLERQVVTLGDGTSSVPILGRCTLRLRIQGYRSIVHALVLPTVLPGFDVALGDMWLKKQGAQVDYRHNRVLLYTKRKLLRLMPCSVMPPATQGDEPSPRHHKLVVAAAMVRLLRKARASGHLPFWVHVMASGELTVTPPGVQDDTLCTQEEIAALLADFADVAEPITGMPPPRDVGHTIPLVPGDHKPPSRPLYRLSPLELEEVRKQVKDLLAKGLIEPSASPFGAPILFVKKKDGTLRMCIDYRALNRITVRNQYPLPRIDDLLDQLAGARIFTSLDLQSGYHQIRITEADRPKTAFKTPMGLYQFKVLSFGLTNAPSTFQSVMNAIFGDLVGKCVMVYLDDILVYSRTPAEHLAHLRAVLQRLREHKLYIKLSKCAFNKPELTYLGHVVGRTGVRVDPDKVRALREFPQPRNITELRAFLGLANYFRKFMPHFSSKVAVLTDILRGGTAKAWKGEPWTAAHRSAFDWVITTLTNAPTLAIPDYTRPFVVTTDASDVGLGAVLEQDGRPVAFASRKLNPAELNYSATEKELLAVVYALKEWRCYLESGVPFTVRTDHNPNTYFQGKSTLSRREARWSECLQQYNFTWEYVKGKSNVVADPLSRVFAWMGTTSCPVMAVTTRRQAAQHTDPFAPADAKAVLDMSQPRALDAPPTALPDDGMLSEPQAPERDPRLKGGRNATLLERIRMGYEHEPLVTDVELVAQYGLDSRKGLWWHNAQVVVPDSEAIRDAIIEEMHDIPAAGHVGITKTLKAVSRLYWWPTLKEDVMTWVRTCDTCQRNKSSRLTKGLLVPLAIPQRAWDSIGMDLITQLPVTKSGHDAIVVFVDRLTKMVHFAPTHTTVTAEQFAKLFVREVWRLHGLPKEIVSDRDPRFTSVFWQEVMRLVGTKQSMSTAFHPATDGQTERCNSILEGMLRHYVSEDQSDWDECLDAAEFAVNNAWQESVRATPFELNFGQQPHMPVSVLVGHNAKAPAAKELVDKITKGVEKARACMQFAQDRYKAHADQGRVDLSFAVGDRVMLSTTNLTLVGAKKLCPRWIGPFKVLRRIGKVAYELDLPLQYAKLHPVFHVGLLKAYHEDPARMHRVPAPKLLQEGEYAPGTRFEVESIVSHEYRPVLGGGGKPTKRTVLWYEIKWVGYNDTTWEPASGAKCTPEILQVYWADKGGIPHNKRSRVDT